MAKAKAHEICTTECPSCFEELTILYSPMKGDTFKCPACNKVHTIDSITRDCRDEPKRLKSVGVFVEAD